MYFKEVIIDNFFLLYIQFMLLKLKLLFSFQEKYLESMLAFIKKAIIFNFPEAGLQIIILYLFTLLISMLGIS